MPATNGTATNGTATNGTNGLNGKKHTSILLKGGNVLQYDSENKVTFPVVDVLVEDQVIAQVGSNIIPEPGTEVIDVAGQIVSPGFVDTHRHLFQSHLRTMTANQTLLQYCGHLLLGKIIYHTPEDLYLAQLGAATEAVHCGVTTVLDHSHVQLSDEHIQMCIKASVESGLRSSYCFGPYLMPTSHNPLTFPEKAQEIIKHQLDVFYQMVEEKPLGGPKNDGRLTLGLACDGVEWKPVEDVRKLLTFAHERNIPMSFHDAHVHGMPSMRYLQKNNLLSNTMIVSHFSTPEDSAFQAAKENGVAISCTPESEMQMSHGWPEGFNSFRYGCKTGLGVDSSAICSGDMFYTMRLLLQMQRARDNAELAERGKVPKRLQATVDQVLYMATLGGAEALNRQAEIGSIEVGKKADMILINTDSPCMVAGLDLGAAMVMHATPADVDTVIINGEIVKRHGELLRVDWKTLKTRLIKSRHELEERWKHVDFDRNTEELGDLWYMTSKLE